MLAYADDQMMAEQEQQMKMQQTASEVCFVISRAPSVIENANARTSL